MENQITVRQDQLLVKYQGEDHCLPTAIITNLPEIVKREVLFVKLNNPDAMGERKSTIDRLISMLAVNFTNEQDMSLARSEFGTFLREYNLTSPEVIEAYRMALKKELQDEKGNTIQVYPNLSLIQAGTILNAYREYKILNHQHSEGIKALKKLTMKEKKQQTPEEIHEEFLRTMYQELNAFGFTPDGWLIFEELEESGRIIISVAVKQRLYRMQRRKYLIEYAADVKSKRRDLIHLVQLNKQLDDLKKQTKPIRPVVNKCRSICVSNYLRKHLADFETFKAAIHG